MERVIYDENGNVIDVVCDHEYDEDGYCTCCGAIKYMSPAYCDIHGCDYPERNDYHYNY